MDTHPQGVTFSFDESVLTEHRKLQLPLNSLKNDSSLSHHFKDQLLNLFKPQPLTDTHTSSDPPRLTSSNLIGSNTLFTTSHSLKYRPVNENTADIGRVVQNKCSTFKNVYNSLIDDTLNELNRIEEAEKELIRRQEEVKRQEEIRRKELEERKRREEEEKRLAQQEKDKQLEQEKQLKDLEKSKLLESNPNLSPDNLENIDYIPKNQSVKVIDELYPQFSQYKSMYNEIKSNTSADVKTLRVNINKNVISSLNTLANTQKQIELIFSRLVQLFRENENMKVFIAFKIVEGVLNLCEEGCQIYINNKSAWSFSRLLAKLTDLDNLILVIYLSLVSERCILTIPRFYHSTTNTTTTTSSATTICTGAGGPPTTGKTSGSSSSDMLKLSKIYKCDLNNGDIKFNKRLKSFLTLHLTFFTVKGDFKSIWSFYSNVVNSCWENIFMPVVPCILITLLEVTSHFMLNLYKLQFKKVLMNIFELFNVKLKGMTFTSSFQMYLGQIDQFYQSYNSKGVIAEPEGFTMKYREEELRKDV